MILTESIRFAEPRFGRDLGHTLGRKECFEYTRYLRGVQIDPALFEENERTSPHADGRLQTTIGDMDLEAGGYLSDVVVAYETWGTLSPARDNAVLVFHALTGDSHAIGWWNAIVGPGKAIDTNQFFVISANVLGGCQGSTGPNSLAADGHSYGSRFPMITVGDMVRAQKRLIDRLGIKTLHALAGGSMGGMLALDWTVRFPGSAKKAFITASGAAHSAMQIGFNETARQAIMRDPKWRGGDYPADDPPVAGLSIARMIGHLSFLSDAAFTSKFGRRLRGREHFAYHLGVEFEVESYLGYQGDKFTRRFDANSLLVLTRAIDYFELKSLQGATTEFLFVSYTSDWLYTQGQAEAMHTMALEAGCVSRHLLVDLPFGHDAFLLDSEQQGQALSEFIA